MTRRAAPLLLAVALGATAALAGCSSGSERVATDSSVNGGGSSAPADSAPAVSSGSAAPATDRIATSDTAAGVAATTVVEAPDTTASAADLATADTIDTSGPGGEAAVTGDTVVVELGGGSSASGVGTTVVGVPVSTLPPASTIPNKGAPVLAAADGAVLPTPVGDSARRIYDAVVRHDFDALTAILGSGRFRYGTLGETRTVERWRAEADEGDDPLRRVVRLFEVAPAVTPKGVVWPYVAVKDPKTWDAADEAVLLSLGFTPETIAATKEKGRYLDERLTFDADGTWTGFAIGG